MWKTIEKDGHIFVLSFTRATPRKTRYFNGQLFKLYGKSEDEESALDIAIAANKAGHSIRMLISNDGYYYIFRKSGYKGV